MEDCRGQGESAMFSARFHICFGQFPAISGVFRSGEVFRQIPLVMLSPWLIGLSVGVRISDRGIPHFWGEMPKLRNALISNDFVCQSNVLAICDFLKIVMNVETPKLDLTENHNELHPFHMILDPGNEPPIFPHLESLDLPPELEGGRRLGGANAPANWRDDQFVLAPPSRPDSVLWRK